jgi:hypothetical protein
MKIEGTILQAKSQTLTTKAGAQLQKTKLRVLDTGLEADGGDIYWIDFLGEAALSDDELEQVHRQQVVIELRKVYATSGSKPNSAYLNANGRAVLFNGQVVQKGLREGGRRVA